MERRDFIRNSGLAVAGLVLSPAFDFSSKRKPYVIIIGAGLAGLSAAYELKKNKVPYIILEARNRVGGRVFTHQMDDQQTCELGGEWVGDSHETIKKLCGEFNLNLIDHRFNTRLIFNEKFYQPEEWSFEEAYARYETARKNFPGLVEKEAKKLDKLDWWRYLSNMGLSERDIEIKELLDSTDFGETIRNVSAYTAMSEYAFSSEKNEMDFWIEGGNSKLAEALKDNAGLENIKTGHAVEKVVQNGKTVTVYCKNGFSVSGDKVICTIPTFAVNKIQWEPAFPDDKTEALNELQYARIMKASVQFNQRFWEDEAFDMITDTPGQYFFHSTKDQKGTKGILTSYTIGDKAYAMSKMNQKQKLETIIDSLSAGFNDISKYVDKSISYYWGSDTYTQGAYAIYDIKQWFSVRPMIAEPFKNIYFAGEHIAEWQGFMEGAAQSGMDAAHHAMS